MAKLKILREGVEVQSVDLLRLSKPSLSLGRAPESDIRIDDRAIGREHALFVISSNGLSVQKKSKFGKLAVNGSETAESALKPGDVIDIASYQLRVEAEQSPVGGQATAHIVDSTRVFSDQAPPDLAHAQESELQAVQASAEGEASSPALESLQGGGESESSINESPVAGAERPSEIDQGMAEDERTTFVSQAKVVTKLLFKPGEANVEEYVIKKPEISLGRGASCDVILSDKKSSRKHLVIKRIGMNFVAKDMGSGNGSYVNGVKITEQELAGDDVLRIGDTEFSFKATSQEYFDQQQEFMAVATIEEATPENDPNLLAPAIDMSGDGALSAPDQFGGQQLSPGLQTPAVDISGAVTGTIPGLASSQSKKKETLVDKFKRQPLPRKIMILIVIAVVLAYVLNEEEGPKKKTQADKPKTPAVHGDATFNALPPEKKQFVQNTYELAFELYKNQEYERAIYEVDKLLQLLPGGYKEAKDIKSYAQKSIEIVKAAEEEKRRKEAEEKLRNEIVSLVSRAQKLVDEGKDAEAKDVFSQVLEKDPDNPTILRLRQQIEEKEQRMKAEADSAKEMEFKRRQLETLLKEGRDLLKAGKYYEAIERMDDAPVIFAGDEKMLNRAKEIIVEAKNTLKAKVQPHLQQAKTAMDAGNLPGARDAYYRALKVDYKNAEAKNGLAKIKDILHDRSKKIYTDAVIAEGISDYRAAKAKYKECFDLSMKEDIYHGRCWRKFRRFEAMDHGEGSSDLSAGGLHSSGGNDPQMPTLPSPVELDKSDEPIPPPLDEPTKGKQ